MEEHTARPAWRDPTHLSYLANNPLSLLGLLLAAVGLILLVTFLLFTLVTPSLNPYFGIIGYAILPGILLAGLVLVPAGMLLKHLSVRRKGRRRPGEALYPRIDLNDPRTRRSILTFAAVSCFGVLPVVAVSGYYGFQWTESTAFCGKLCHTVMKPQYVAHERSAHARVRCAECHIGPGASWFVKSKITGLGQVVAVLRNDYPKPLPNAITHLRPARETCEECHWPAQFFGSEYKELVRYLSNETNTPFVVRMLLKTGGSRRFSGRVEGIHMHMTEAGSMEYVATDPDLQNIVWVRRTPPDGHVVIYRSDGKPNDAPPPVGVKRKLDCMDCHNRGAHHFRPPQATTDLRMSDDQIDTTLPYIKRVAVSAMFGPYRDEKEAGDSIRRDLTEFYRMAYPEIWAKRQAAVREAAEAVVQSYEEDTFPHMKEDWLTYPENVGHKDSAGCFRCHDGLHVDASGKAVRSGCSICHVFLIPMENHPDTLVKGSFQHPMDLSKHRNPRCNQCHTGGELLGCLDCHVTGKWLSHRGKAEFRYEGD